MHLCRAVEAYTNIRQSCSVSTMLSRVVLRLPAAGGCWVEDTVGSTLNSWKPTALLLWRVIISVPCVLLLLCYNWTRAWETIRLNELSTERWAGSSMLFHHAEYGVFPDVRETCTSHTSWFVQTNCWTKIYGRSTIGAEVHSNAYPVVIYHSYNIARKSTDS